MNIHRSTRTIAFLFAAAAAATPIFADPPVSINRYTIDCGGSDAAHPSTGGVFSLVGTMAQIDTGAPMAGGTFSIAGGILPGSGPTPPCPGDFNQDGILNSQDLFDFIAALFELHPRADFNHNGAINSQDYFDFITAFFGGCP